MKRTVLSCGLALALLASCGPATAQVSLRGAQTSGGLPAASVATSPSHTGLATADAAPTSEPRAMTGMLAAQNDARTRLNLAPLSWSAALAARAEETVNTAADGGCSLTSASKAAATDGASMFWAPALRRVDGAGIVQDIMPSFLVTEWKQGRGDYDSTRSECRKSGACEQYARMVAPAARAVGCARTVCSNQAQVWACQYSDGKGASAPVPPATGLRSRQGD